MVHRDYSVLGKIKLSLHSTLVPKGKVRLQTSYSRKAMMIQPLDRLARSKQRPSGHGAHCIHRSLPAQAHPRKLKVVKLHSFGDCQSYGKGQGRTPAATGKQCVRESF